MARKKAESVNSIVKSLPKAWREPVAQLLASASFERVADMIRAEPSLPKAFEKYFNELSESAFALYGSLDHVSFDDGTPNIEETKNRLRKALGKYEFTAHAVIDDLVSSALDYAAGSAGLLVADSGTVLDFDNDQLATDLLAQLNVIANKEAPADAGLPGKSRLKLSDKSEGAIRLQQATLVEAAIQLWSQEIAGYFAEAFQG